MQQSIEGKVVAIAGKLESMSTAEAAKLLESKGALIAKTLHKRVGVLLAGKRAESKIAKANELGVEVHGEDWLLALRDGKPLPAPEATTEAAAATGPLADWVARLEALATTMRMDPRVSVTFYLGEPIAEAELARIEAKWQVDGFAPAIRNLYRQANGLCFLWISTHHPAFAQVKAHWTKQGWVFGGFGRNRVAFSSMPTSHQVDGFSEYVGESVGVPPCGAIYLPPLEQVAGGAEGFLPDSPVRVFDYPRDRCPAALVMEPGVSDPRVVLARDHRSWDEGRYASFESYMEHVLATLGTLAARSEWFAGPTTESTGSPGSLSLDALLPPSVTLVTADDGATFDLRVEAIEVQGGGGGGDDARVAALAKLIPSHRVKEVAKVLDLKPLNRKSDILLAEIAAATADPNAIDSKTAGKLMGAANQRSKTKAAFLEAFAVGAGGGGGSGGEALTIRVETCFNRSSLSNDEVDFGFGEESTIKRWLGELGVRDVDDAWVSAKAGKASGKAARSTTLVVHLSRPSGLEVGQRARSTAVPFGFRRVGDEVVRVLS